jgi:hypothetical protein
MHRRKKQTKNPPHLKMPTWDRDKSTAPCTRDQDRLSWWKPTIKATKQTTPQGPRPPPTLAPGVWQKPPSDLVGAQTKNLKNSFGVLTLSTIIVDMYSCWLTSRCLFFFAWSGFFVRPLFFLLAGGVSPAPASAGKW